MEPWKEPGREMRWEAALERLESAAWSLAGGVLCAFVIAVVLKNMPWPVGFAIAAASVVGWSLAASPVVGAVLGVVAWTFVTGFDVVGSGDLVVRGSWDLARLLALAGAGTVAGAVGTRMRRASAP